jgi:molybdopterin-guanine dinucleotide biosynthesis protein A
VDVLILAGGEARRLGGVDKPMVEIGGWTLLDRVIEAVHDAGLSGAEFGEGASANAVTVVGPVRPTRRTVRWAREDPPGGGPVAAIVAGLSKCRSPYVGVFAGDLPFLNAEAVHSLWTALAESETDRYDGAVAVDANGREQWLAAVYRRGALLAKIAEQDADDLRGLALRRLVGDLRLLRIAPTGQSVLDCDTWEDVAAARRIADDDSRDHHLRDHGPRTPRDERT